MKIKMCEEFFYRVEDSELLMNKFNTCNENILRNNKNISIYCGEWIKIRINDFQLHHVKPAENLNTIANLYCVSKEKIKLDNNLNSERLYIGQILKIYNKQ